MPNGTCAHCGGPAPRRGTSGPWPTYCSPTCKRTANYQRTRADGRYDAQLLAARRARVRPAEPARCAYCSAPFLRKRSDHRFCSTRCLNAGNPRRCTRPGCERPHRAKGLCNRHYNDERYPDQRYEFPIDPEAKRKRDLVRAKRRRAVQRRHDAEDVDRDVVGQRDGWRCGICHRSINQAISYPDPMCVSLDHIVPISQGGPHTYANSRVAHLRCNMARGNKGGHEQLALLG